MGEFLSIEVLYLQLGLAGLAGSKVFSSRNEGKTTVDQCSGPYVLFARFYANFMQIQNCTALSGVVCIKL